MRLRRIGRDFSYGDAVIWIDELLKETGSHLYAESAGQDLAGSQADVAGIFLAEAYAHVHRDPKQTGDPIRLPKPWRPVDPNADVTPERRAELVAQLEARSAFKSAA